MFIVIYIAALLATCLAADCAIRRPWNYPIFLLCAGVLEFGAETGEGMNVSALWLLALIGLGIVALIRMPVGRVSFSWPEKAYLMFLAWCLLEAVQAPGMVYAARMFIKLAFPCLVLVLARRAVLTGRLNTWKSMRYVFIASLVAYCFVGGPTQRLLPIVCWNASVVFWAFAAFADHAAILGVAALVWWRLYKNRWYLGYAFLAAVSPALAGIRTGVAAFAIGASVFLLTTYRRAVAIPMVAGIYVLAAATFFLVPEFRQRMFFHPNEVDSTSVSVNPFSVSTENIDTSGRTAIWEMSMTQLWDPHPIAGSGLGAIQEFMYTQQTTDLKVVHSSYVEFLCDTGLVGLTLFILATISCWMSGFRMIFKQNTRETKAFGLCAVCGLPALWFCMGFDNLNNFVLVATQFPYAFLGIAQGLSEIRRHSPQVGRLERRIHA